MKVGKSLGGWNAKQQAGTCGEHFNHSSPKSTGTPLLCQQVLNLCEREKKSPAWCKSGGQTTSMKTPGMAVFNQQNVEDFYEIGEVLGR